MFRPLGLEDRVIVALRRITRAIDLHSRLLLKKCGLTAPQLTALLAIQRLQPVAAGRLAKEIHLGQATVTGILSRMESRQLIVRTRGSEDRRSVLVELTETGKDLLRQTPSPLQERFRNELSRLHEWERTSILSTLQRIAAMMDAEQIDAAPVLASGTTCVDEEEEQGVVPSVQGDIAFDASPFAVESMQATPDLDGFDRNDPSGPPPEGLN